MSCRLSYPLIARSATWCYKSGPAQPKANRLNRPQLITPDLLTESRTPATPLGPTTAEVGGSSPPRLTAVVCLIRPDTPYEPLAIQGRIAHKKQASMSDETDHKPHVRSPRGGQLKVPDDDDRDVSIGRVDGRGAQTMEAPDVSQYVGRSIAAGRRIAVGDYQWVAAAGLLAATDLKAERNGGRQVVACQMPLLGEIGGAAVGPGPGQGRADAVREQATQIRDHQMATGAEHANEFHEDRSQFRDMREREGTDNDVDVIVGQGQVVQVSLVEIASGNLGPGLGEHVRRDVNADDLVAKGGQILGMAPGSAGGVKGDALRQTVENVPDDGLLQIEKPITGLVVELCPGAIRVDSGDQLGFSSRAHAPGGVKQGTDLCQACLGEVAIVHSGEGVQQGYAFQAHQIRQRVDVDHQCMLDAVDCAPIAISPYVRCGPAPLAGTVRGSLARS